MVLVHVGVHELNNVVTERGCHNVGEGDLAAADRVPLVTCVAEDACSHPPKHGASGTAASTLRKSATRSPPPWPPPPCPLSSWLAVTASIKYPRSLLLWTTPWNPP